MRTLLVALASLALTVHAHGYEPADVSDGGTVRGVVSTSAPASSSSLDVTQDNGVCGDSVPVEEVIAKNGKLANAVVWVDDIASGRAATPGKISLDQTGCRYVPHVQAATKGSTITVINSDDVLHNVNSNQGGRTAFNLAMPTKGQEIDKSLRKSGLVTVGCDAGHTWMRAYIQVFDHPYFAVTGIDGAFEIPDLPPGTYSLKVWHETLGERSAAVTIEAGGSHQASFEL